MTKNRSVRWVLGLMLVPMISLLAVAQDDRGKAELTAPGGKVVVDYGRPQLKGRDPLTWQKEGSYWRMGMNAMTTLTTPAELVFGTKKLAKGSYSVWLLKAAADKYELVLNSETSGMGMSHDKAKDVANIPMKKGTAPASVETFTIDLKPSGKGGQFVMTWGTTALSADFLIGK